MRARLSGRLRCGSDSKAASMNMTTLEKALVCLSRGRPEIESAARISAARATTSAPINGPTTSSHASTLIARRMYLWRAARSHVRERCVRPSDERSSSQLTRFT